MDKYYLCGELVHLTAIDPQETAAVVARYSRDSEYSRLQDSFPCRQYTKDGTQKWIEKQLEEQRGFSFAIRTLVDDRLIGDVGLGGLSWNQGDAYIGIGIGEREFWGKGYGSDAMGIMLQYAFTELNLHRVTLNVFEYNQRAIRSYEKVGFQHEGRVRKYLNREGRRWDMMFMGILREEWLVQNTSHQNL